MQWEAVHEDPQTMAFTASGADFRDRLHSWRRRVLSRYGVAIVRRSDPA
jgi:hypothetical protein